MSILLWRVIVGEFSPHTVCFTALPNCAETYWEPLSVLKTSFEQSGFLDVKDSVNAAITPSVAALTSNVYLAHSQVNVKNVEYVTPSVLTAPNVRHVSLPKLIRSCGFWALP